MRWGLLAALLASPAPGAELTAQEREARYYYDLGPETIDVSGYPQKQQEAYGLFELRCGKCHTLARAVSSPLVKREDWRRFLKRMHLRSSGALPARELRAILDFLEYDSSVRKVKGKAAFDAQSQALKERFEDVSRQRRSLEPTKDVKTRSLQDVPAVKPSADQH